MLTPVVLTALSDNYVYLLTERDRACVIDPAEREPVLAALKARNLTLDLILNTHHHADHCGGNTALKAAYGCQVWGGSRMVAGVDRVLADNETVEWRGHAIRILATPGHTRDSLCFYWPDSKLLFTGDTLFVGGCGRLFEGNAQDLWQSFQKILALPDDTFIYCGHDYGLENLKFASQYQPHDSAVRNRLLEMQASVRGNQPLVPSTLEQEKSSNVFLRCKNPAELAHWRELKNKF